VADGIRVLVHHAALAPTRTTYDFAELVSRTGGQAEAPGLATIGKLKKKRARSAVDHRQNGAGKTIASDTRPTRKTGATVSNRRCAGRRSALEGGRSDDLGRARGTRAA